MLGHGHGRRASQGTKGLLSPAGASVLVRPRRDPDRALCLGLLVERTRAGGSSLLRAPVLRDGGLPPLLRSSRLQDLALVPVRARAARRHERAKGSPLVGRSSSPP